MYNSNYYGLNPYMYDSPYEILRKAQDGYIMSPEDAYAIGAPIEADYKSYNEFADAYSRWKAMNSPSQYSTSGASLPLPTSSSNVSLQTPSSSIFTDNKSERRSYRSKKPNPKQSVVDLLDSVGFPSDYQSRKKLASTLGIKGYTGHPTQNMQMLSVISSNPQILKAISPAAVTAKSNTSNNITIEQDEDGNTIVVDSTGTPVGMLDSLGNVVPIRNSILAVDSTGAKIDSSGAKRDSIPLTTGKLPTPTFIANEEDGLSNIQKLLIGMGSVAVAGGLTYGALKDADDVAKIAKQYGTSAYQAELAKKVFKKMQPKLQSAMKAYENLGAGGQEIYNVLEDLIKQDEDIAAAIEKEASKIKPLSDYSADELKTFNELSAQEKIDLATMEKQAGLRGKNAKTISSTTPKKPSAAAAKQTFQPQVVRIAGTPTQLAKKAPIQLGKRPLPPAPSKFQQAANYIKSSTPVQKAGSFLNELKSTVGTKYPNVAKNLRGVAKVLRLQDGGQADMQQQIVQYIAMELQKGTDPQEIAQTLITQGIGQDQAFSIIEQVAKMISDQESQQSMGEMGDEEMYAQEEPIDEGQEGMMPEEYANGGGYSGTYDQMSGSYFQRGGSFVPTYGDILPQYMYGSDYMQEGGSAMGYNIGDTLEVSPQEMEYLRQQGYDFDTI